MKFVDILQMDSRSHIIPGARDNLNFISNEHAL